MTLTDERVPFTSIDEVVHLLDTPAEPWSIQMQIQLSGVLDLLLRREAFAPLG